jgi:hypothetical protein
MAQVTIYVDSDLEAKMRAAAQAMNLSQSKWITNIIREKLDNEWPANVIVLTGAWADFPEAEEIRSAMGVDTEREQI